MLLLRSNIEDACLQHRIVERLQSKPPLCPRLRLSGCNPELGTEVGIDGIKCHTPADLGFNDFGARLQPFVDKVRAGDDEISPSLTAILHRVVNSGPTGPVYHVSMGTAWDSTGLSDECNPMSQCRVWAASAEEGTALSPHPHAGCLRYMDSWGEHSDTGHRELVSTVSGKAKTLTGATREHLKNLVISNTNDMRVLCNAMASFDLLLAASHWNDGYPSDAYPAVLANYTHTLELATMMHSLIHAWQLDPVAWVCLVHCFEWSRVDKHDTPSTRLKAKGSRIDSLQGYIDRVINGEVAFDHRP